MDTRVIPLSDLQADAAGILGRCVATGQGVVVELPNRERVSIQPVEPGDELIDELIAGNAAFRAMLERSLAGPREPFPFDEPNG
jgi:hypothetical protein